MGPGMKRGRRGCMEKEEGCRQWGKGFCHKMDSLLNILEGKSSCHEEELLMAKADIKVQIITSWKCIAMFFWYCADLNYFFALYFGFCVDVRKKKENTVQNKYSHLLENTAMQYKDCITFIAVKLNLYWINTKMNWISYKVNLMWVFVDFDLY